MHTIINRSDLMRLAWTWARQELAYSFIYDWTPGPTYGQRRTATVSEKRSIFADCLRKAWAEMKARAQQWAAHIDSLGALVERSSASLLAELNDSENRSHIDADGWARIEALRAALSVVREREAEKRELIASAKGRFCAVTFTKKDGTERTMQVQPAALHSRLKGDAATDAGKRAAESRRASHPNLLPVWDAQKRAARSINLATVTRIAVDGREHLFRA
ncbi:hypothetical protein [Roseivivax sediminis]|uniref:Uncharacterized protein n=1 Tax=Roseivivax sediminis TaxID=936889 RepID=A0A1I1UDD4_9RHOB|nr:hypothetical protein [Roseivivax sediminis]SFD67618.1 hypothetical protein SAMN04515678_102235 [Roseivivax sediminis]